MSEVGSDVGVMTANPVDTIRLVGGCHITEKDRRLGRTHDHIISPWRTMRRARLGALRKSNVVVSLTCPGVTEAMSTYSISPSNELPSDSRFTSATSPSVF